MTDEETARALEEAILGGEPFNYPCGCFGVILKVHEWNANWVNVERRVSCSLRTRLRNGTAKLHYTPPDAVALWRKRDGTFITKDEWAEHVAMSEYVYGK